VGAVVTIAVHHVAVNYCQAAGLTLLSQPVVIFDYGTGLGIVILHAAFVIFEAAFLGAIVITLTRQFCESVKVSNQTIDVLNVLDHVISTRDTSQRISKDNDHAHVVNGLLDMINSHAAVAHAADNAGTALVIADRDSKIVRANTAARRLFDTAKTAFATAGVHIDTRNLEGMDVTALLATATTRPDLALLRQASLETLSVGDRSLTVRLNPVLGNDNDVHGYVLEWADITNQRSIEAEVQRVAEAAVGGDLAQRISLDNKDGFLLTLSQNMNQLVGAAQEIIDATVTTLDSVARGDLTRRVDGAFEGQFAALQAGTNATVEKLAEVVRQIKGSATTLLESSTDAESMNRDLARHTEQQARNVVATVGTIKSVTDKVARTAEHSSAASAAAREAKDRAERSGAVVGEAVDAMTSIRDASQRIVDIIDLIDEIAFQTNLLALNAAVEAARAGDKGRGFAVVAAEVRDLAGRSARAAGEIKSLIDDCNHRVEEGTRYVNRSRDALNDISSSVVGFTDTLGEIAQLCQEQAESVGEVRNAIDELEGVFQRNVHDMRGAEQSAVQAGEHARALDRMTTFFTLDANRGARVRQPPAQSVA
ncbi:MAG: methyl-accepting chemotaxis protein, partial [Pseudomonadota bacterium]